jgi:hypothetical protein
LDGIARRGAGVRGQRFANGVLQMTWYVSYVASGDVSGDRVRRTTKTFASEHEAKSFARAKFEAGDKTLVAGTINPETPKRVISSSAIPDWLDGAPER